MQVYAGHGCKVYRPNEDGSKYVLTEVPIGEPVPELRSRDAGQLKRLAARGTIKVDWSVDGDPLVVAAEMEAKGDPVGDVKREKERLENSEPVLPKVAPGGEPDISVHVATTRGVTEHLVDVSKEGEHRLLCGRKYDEEAASKVTNAEKENSKLCEKCAKRAA